ncbi:unnamed protein product, partial [Musa hybrid cultivar]
RQPSTARSSANRTFRHGGPSSAFAPAPPEGATTKRRKRDAQAGVPLAGWPRAQLAFKDSMVHGILQFTPGIAFRYVLHRCESRDIRCRESSNGVTVGNEAYCMQRGPPTSMFVFLGAIRAGVGWYFIPSVVPPEGEPTFGVLSG